jgi:tRNA (cytidine/uridine-2'-O-)-methyltransferase
MDYLDLAQCHRHRSWDDFLDQRGSGRLVLITTRGRQAPHDFSFGPDDILLFGRESAGVPESVHAQADHRLRVPMRPGARSLNVAMTAALVAGEALRQTTGFPVETSPQ